MQAHHLHRPPMQDGAPMHVDEQMRGSSHCVHLSSWHGAAGCLTAGFDAGRERVGEAAWRRIDHRARVARVEQMIQNVLPILQASAPGLQVLLYSLCLCCPRCIDIQMHNDGVPPSYKLRKTTTVCMHAMVVVVSWYGHWHLVIWCLGSQSRLQRAGLFCSQPQKRLPDQNNSLYSLKSHVEQPARQNGPSGNKCGRKLVSR